LYRGLKVGIVCLFVIHGWGAKHMDIGFRRNKKS